MGNTRGETAMMHHDMAWKMQVAFFRNCKSILLEFLDMEGGNIQTAVAGGKLGLMVLVYGIGWVSVRWAMDTKKGDMLLYTCLFRKIFHFSYLFSACFFATPLLGLQLL